MTPELVGVWEVGDGADLDGVMCAARDRTREPTFRCTVLSSTGDTLGLQVVGDDLPSGDTNVFYVGGHGAFEVVRVERWPPTQGGKKPRVLLKLRAWSAR